jgi:hypothetical protein
MEGTSQINPSVSGQEWKTNYNWDFFLAHARHDTETAKTLYQSLTPPAKVFLDAVNLRPGDNWNILLPNALKTSLINIILVTPNTEDAYYEQDEVAMAIKIFRNDRHTRRVVPICIGFQPSLPPVLPYGLNSLVSLYISNPEDFKESGRQLLDTLDYMKKQEPEKEQLVSQQREAIIKITNPVKKADVVSGLAEITQLDRAALIGCIVLFVITLVSLLIVAAINLENKVLLMLFLGTFCALFGAVALRFISKSLSQAPQLAQGRINSN